MSSFPDINLLVSPSHYAFKSPSAPDSPSLIIHRPSADIQLDHADSLSHLRARRVSTIAGILGIITLKLDKYIIVITKSKPIGRLRGHPIHRVLSTEFLPLRDRPLHDPDEDHYLALLKLFVASSPLYFSYTHDLTNSFQRQAELAPAHASLPLWKRADDRFFWNRHVLSDLISFREGSVSRGGSAGGANPNTHGIDPFILPVIFGMVDITHTAVNAHPFTFALISRRSRHRAGTRYFSRGIDEAGHVANYNETEQVLIFNDVSARMTGFGGTDGLADEKRAAGANNGDLQVLSYVQIRGSVPVYWSEINNLKYTPRLQVRPVQLAVPAARKHFTEQIATYGEVYLVNLVNQSGREREVKQAYEDIVRLLLAGDDEKGEKREGIEDTTHPDPRSPAHTAEKTHVIQKGEQEPVTEKTKLPGGNAGGDMDRLHYVYFDFHSETKGLRWHRAELLLQQLEAGLSAGEYFHGVDHQSSNTATTAASAVSGNDAPLPPLTILRTQKAVVRTNCMDCLDRTNVVQSMLARWALDRQLTDLGVLRPGTTAFPSVSVSGNTDAPEPGFPHLFRNVWADNADAVSKTYSGTGALKTDFTRTGQRTKVRGPLMDGLNSITRYVRNNFADGYRQDAFDVFLGRNGAFLGVGGNGSVGMTAGDRRPLVVRSVPYVLGASVFLVAVAIVSGGSASKGAADVANAAAKKSGASWTMRLFTLVWTLVAGWCVRFIWGHGMLYVNWPRINTPAAAVDGYLDALARAAQDQIVGRFIAPSATTSAGAGAAAGVGSAAARRARAFSNVRVGYMEEGKKRVE